MVVIALYRIALATLVLKHPGVSNLLSGYQISIAHRPSLSTPFKMVVVKPFQVEQVRSAPEYEEPLMRRFMALN
jgi:hypothetical protein